jgi:hypothetical protein
MTKQVAQLGLWLAAGWVALLALFVLGITLFQEPDDGVWVTRTWVEKAVEGALSVLGAIGAILLVRRSRASRWTAVPLLVVIGGLSGWAFAELAIRKVQGPPERWSTTDDIWANGILALASVAFTVFILRPATWRALENEAKV